MIATRLRGAASPRPSPAGGREFRSKIDARCAFICDAVRTPIGRYGGALDKVRTDDLAAVHGLEKRGGKRALATMCVGVGQGVSVAVERINNL